MAKILDGCKLVCMSHTSLRGPQPCDLPQGHAGYCLCKKCDSPIHLKRRPVGEIVQTEEAAKIWEKWKPSVVGLICGLFLLSGCGSGNLDYLKANADKRWEELGFTVVGYQGYKWGPWGIFGSRYGGARVWYELRRTPDNGITYSGFLWRWGNEIHTYDIRARDVIWPRN